MVFLFIRDIIIDTLSDIGREADILISIVTTGTPITITGTNSSDTAAVFITSSNSSALNTYNNVIVVNSTTITALFPYITASQTTRIIYKVVLNNGQQFNILINRFTVTATALATPNLISISPTNVTIRLPNQTTNVILIGRNFGGTTTMSYSG